MKVNGNRDILWEEVFDKYYFSVPAEIINDSNNNYIIIGYCKYEDISKKTYILRIDSSGNITDYKYLESDYTEKGSSIIKIEDSYYCTSWRFGNQFVLRKMNSEFDISWEKVFLENGASAKDIIFINDSIYLVGKSTQQKYDKMTINDIFLLRTDINGNKTVLLFFEHPEVYESAHKILLTMDNNLLIVGSAWDGKIYTIKFKLG